MIKIWNKVQEKSVTKREAQCLWGIAQDIMILLNELNLPTELGSGLIDQSQKATAAAMQIADK